MVQVAADRLRKLARAEGAEEGPGDLGDLQRVRLEELEVEIEHDVHGRKGRRAHNIALVAGEDAVALEPDVCRVLAKHSLANHLHELGHKLSSGRARESKGEQG